ncbi:MAG: hypothetical protein ACP5O0_00360 [Acidimicrobiales bacterium]
MQRAETPSRLSSSDGGGVISTSIAIAVILTVFTVIAQLGIVGLEFLHLQAIANSAVTTAALAPMPGGGSSVTAAEATITRLWSRSLGVAEAQWTTSARSTSLTLTAVLPVSSDPVLHYLGLSTLSVHASQAREVASAAP